MAVKNLRCMDCKSSFRVQLLYNCPHCGGILDVEYDYRHLTREDVFFQPGKGLWRFNKILPLMDATDKISLGEGNTPLLECPKIANYLGAKSLYVKDETRNPTGSFKDRPVPVAISQIKSYEKPLVITSSSGNAGAAVAAYAARSGLKCLIVAPNTAPENKLLQILAYGATLIRTNVSPSDCFMIVREISLEYQVANVITTFLNPFATEGNKTLAYEIFEQLPETESIWIVIPVGVGPLLYGCFKGYRELRKLGLISFLPKMAGIQAKGCEPIVKAFESGSKTVEPWGSCQTIASGLADPLDGYVQDGDLTLNTIRESNGAALSVDDDALLESVLILGKTAGIFAEPSAAASIAGAKELISRGIIKQNDTVVCIVTGSGFKEIGAIQEKIKMTGKIVSADINDLKHIIQTELEQ